VKIPLHRPYLDKNETTNIEKVLRSGWLTKGPVCEEFEKKCADYIGTKYAIAVTSCTAALHLSLLSLDLNKGDEVLVSDYTFPATGHSVLYCGLIPKFVDIKPTTFNIDPSLIEKNITNKTKAIIPVHAFGQPADMDSIMEIARKHNLKVIEDAACAFGSIYKNRKTGSLSDIGCFSFHATKGITTGEGGLVTTDNEEIANKVRSLSVFGRESSWEVEKSEKFIIPNFYSLGYNYKMPDILASIGLAQLNKVEEIIRRRIYLSDYLSYKLKDLDEVTVPYIREDVRHNFQSYNILIDKKIDRNCFIERMRDDGVQVQIGTYSSYCQPIYSKFIKIDYKCPISLDVFNRSVRLPLFYNLTKKEIDQVVSLLKKNIRRL
jgi:dTDP-4-amino-4,6-dideoxygalactose transaminase